MKFILSLLTLAVLAGLNNSASVQHEYASRANLIVGSPRPGDSLLQRRVIVQRAVRNAIQYQDYIFNGNARTNITAVRAIENVRQSASARIIAGGLRRNTVTVRLQTARGRGFNYTIEIYGRL